MALKDVDNSATLVTCSETARFLQHAVFIVVAKFLMTLSGKRIPWGDCVVHKTVYSVEASSPDKIIVAVLFSAQTTDPSLTTEVAVTEDAKLPLLFIAAQKMSPVNWLDCRTSIIKALEGKVSEFLTISDSMSGAASTVGVDVG